MPIVADSATFRQILGHYPTGVCAITGMQKDGTPVAMIVGSFTSVSLDPPLVAFFPDKASSSWPNIEVRRKDGELLVTAEVPGMSEDDIELSLDDGMLVIRGERRSEDGDEASGYSERFYGQFERRMSLPQGIQEDKVSAEFRDGVLRIHLPHDEQMSLSGRRIPINQETRH